MKSLHKQKQMERFKDYIGLGVAGNFALHLAQAGELEDFKDIITADETAPKGVFPFYLPCHVKSAKDILSTFPLSSSLIELPPQHVNIQIEPEVALICEFEYENGTLSKIKPTHFGAYNDCSIRVAGASKISEKKNWGKNSKGLSQNLIKIDSFSDGGVMDNFIICSYLKRGDEVSAYGEAVELNGYSYFYEKLLDWLVNQINTQTEFGPLEDIAKHMSECSYPKNSIISIGATRYTEYGEKTFLQKDDLIFVILFDKTKVNMQTIIQSIKNDSFDTTFMSILKQRVV